MVTQDTEGINVTKFTASLEPSDVSFQSNKDLKIGGDHFTPPPYQTRVNPVCLNSKMESLMADKHDFKWYDGRWASCLV